EPGFREGLTDPGEKIPGKKLVTKIAEAIIPEQINLSHQPPPAKKPTHTKIKIRARDPPMGSRSSPLPVGRRGQPEPLSPSRSLPVWRAPGKLPSQKGVGRGSLVQQRSVTTGYGHEQP